MIKTNVIILGSGIAGLTLSLLLKRKKINHVVLDRVKKQKVMPLAETVPPSAMTLLENLQLLPLFTTSALRKTYGYHAMWGTKQLQTTHFFNSNPFKYGLKINKQDVRDALYQEVSDCVLPYDQLAMLDSDTEGFRLEIKQDKQTQHIEAQQMVDATGRKRALINHLQIPVKAYDSIMAFSCHLPKVKHPDLIHEVYTESFADGWGIVSGLNETSQVMSLYSHKEAGLHKALSEYSNWKNILADTHYLKHFLAVEAPETILGGHANSSAPDYFAKDNYLAIGDAAMAFDPLSSHGITNAVYTADRAAKAIVGSSYSFNQYHKDLQEIYKGYLETKNSLYQREQRWTENAFWKYFQETTLV